MVRIPTKIEEKTKTERSLFFVTEIIPVTKAVISMRNETGTVTSHQWSSKLSILSTKTEITETLIIIRNRMFNPADHLPNFVLGLIIILFLI